MNLRAHTPLAVTPALAEIGFFYGSVGRVTVGNRLPSNPNSVDEVRISRPGFTLFVWWFL